MNDRLLLRRNLKNSGFLPIPVYGKRPPMKQWSRLEVTDEEINEWEKAFPYATSTGLLCRNCPALDIDILSEEAAEAVEGLVRERFEEAGYILTRIGLSPKRLIPF